MECKRAVLMTARLLKNGHGGRGPWRDDISREGPRDKGWETCRGEIEIKMVDQR